MGGEGISGLLGHADRRALIGLKSLYYFSFFFFPGGLLHKQGPRGARIWGAPLPHSHNALVATPCSVCPPAGGPKLGSRSPPTTPRAYLCSVEGPSVPAGSQFLGVAPAPVWADFVVLASSRGLSRRRRTQPAPWRLVRRCFASTTWFVLFFRFSVFVFCSFFRSRCSLLLFRYRASDLPLEASSTNLAAAPTKQGPRGARLRGAPLPHSHNALVATSCSVYPPA
jgi:hypothetical protein